MLYLSKQNFFEVCVDISPLCSVDIYFFRLYNIYKGIHREQRKGKYHVKITYKKTVSVKGEYDIAVVGGGVAGCAAALSAAREGKKVILFEKGISLGGLATLGLINLFVPVCNGEGTQIIYGMCEEFLKDSIEYGYDTLPEVWADGEPKNPTRVRKFTKFDAPIFSLVLLNKLHDAGVEVCFDTIITDTVTNDGMCEAVIVENKSGTSCYKAKMFVDASGDADLLNRAGVPTVTGKNYHSYMSRAVTLDGCKNAVMSNDISKAVSSRGPKVFASLYGDGHPESIPTYNATDADDVNRYLISNQLELFDVIKNDSRKSRTLTMLPVMPQFRTSRRIDGDATLNAERDAYKHFDDSVAAINDFDRRDFLYEVSYKMLVRTGFDNIIAAGRCTSGEGYGWDLLRVIPVAIITGQVAGLASAQKIDTSVPIYSIDVPALQNKLISKNVKIHFDDSLIPDVIESVRVDVGEL